jgi:hypothetical protein
MTGPHLILNDELTWHDRGKWNEAVSLLRDFFSHHKSDRSEMNRLAMALKGQIDAVDHFIQLNTAQVCPDCQKVCCINRHGYYDYQDLIYITALGLTPPLYGEGIVDTAPCQFLSEYGCAIDSLHVRRPCKTPARIQPAIQETAGVATRDDRLFLRYSFKRQFKQD